MTRAEAIDELCRLVSYIPIMLIDTVPKHQKDRFVRALKVGINSLRIDEQYDLAMEQADTVSLKAYEQVMCERDIAIQQLKELGYEFGEKIEPCGDAISRQAVIDGINVYFHDDYYQRTSIQDCRDCLIRDVIKALPPVTPQEPKTIQEKQAESEKYEKAYDDGYKNGYAQARFDYEQEPKTGHWILTSDDDYEYCTCSECGYQNGENWMIGSQIKYCQECGCRMFEPQESEDKKMTNQEKFIQIFGIDAWQQMIVFSGLAEQFKEYWTSPYNEMDCRDCKEYEDCPCGKDGHESGTSQGYSIGECKDFEPQESEVQE